MLRRCILLHTVTINMIAKTLTVKQSNENVY
jgi:hypothetical protein